MGKLLAARGATTSARHERDRGRRGRAHRGSLARATERRGRGRGTAPQRVDLRSAKATTMRAMRACATANAVFLGLVSATLGFAACSSGSTPPQPPPGARRASRRAPPPRSPRARSPPRPTRPRRSPRRRPPPTARSSSATSPTIRPPARCALNNAQTAEGRGRDRSAGAAHRAHQEQARRLPLLLRRLGQGPPRRAGRDEDGAQAQAGRRR